MHTAQIRSEMRDPPYRGNLIALSKQQGRLNLGTGGNGPVDVALFTEHLSAIEHHWRVDDILYAVVLLVVAQLLRQRLLALHQLANRVLVGSKRGDTKIKQMKMEINCQLISTICLPVQSWS